MKKRFRGPEDSLDLLLDTMCNAFGGIVLIAILVAILIENPGEEPGKSTVSRKETQEVVRKARELAGLEKELLQIKIKMEENKDLLELVRKRDKLENTLTTRQATESLSIEEIKERIGKAFLAKEKAIDAAAQLTSEIASVDEAINEQRRLLEQLEIEMKELIASRMDEILPSQVRDGSGRQLNVIIRYGEIFLPHYPKYSEKGAFYGFSKNEDSIKWKGNTAFPIRGRGLSIDRDTEMITSFLRKIYRNNRVYQQSPSKHLFISSAVYGDSFSAIGQFRKMTDEIGFIKDGWDPWMDDIGVTIGDFEKAKVD